MPTAHRKRRSGRRVTRSPLVQFARAAMRRGRLRRAPQPIQHDAHALQGADVRRLQLHGGFKCRRSEEHTSELQSRQYLVCRLLLEKKKKTTKNALVGLKSVNGSMASHWQNLVTSSAFTGLFTW